MVFPDKILQRIEEESRREYLPIIGRKKGEFLFGLLEKMRPCRPLEIGTLTGYATSIIASTLAEGCRVVGIEINTQMVDRAESNLIAAGLENKTKLLRGDALEELDALGGGFDFVLLDSQKTQYLGMLKKLEPRLASQAIVVANGTGQYQKETASYLEYLHKSEKWQSRSETFGDDAMEISQFLG